MNPPLDTRFIIQFATPGHYDVNFTFNFGVQHTTEDFHPRGPLCTGNFYGINPNPMNQLYPPQIQMQQYSNGHCPYMRGLPPPCNDFSSSSFEASSSSNAPGSTSNSWHYVPPQALQSGYGFTPPYTPYNNNQNAYFNGGKPFQTPTPPSVPFGEKSSSEDTAGCFSSKKCNIM